MAATSPWSLRVCPRQGRCPLPPHALFPWAFRHHELAVLHPASGARAWGRRRVGPPLRGGLGGAGAGPVPAGPFLLPLWGGASCPLATSLPRGVCRGPWPPGHRPRDLPGQECRWSPGRRSSLWSLQVQLGKGWSLPWAAHHREPRSPSSPATQAPPGDGACRCERDAALVGGGGSLPRTWA